MNKKFLLLIISSLFGFFVHAQSYRQDFIRAMNAHDMKKAEEVLKNWDLTNVNDPELYVAFFNFFTVKSMDSNVLSLNKLDQNYSKQALEYISEGIQRFPIRLDMRIAKLEMLGELDEYQDYVLEILNLIVQSAKIKNNWKEEDFLSVDYGEDMFFGVVADAQGFLFSKNDSTLFKDILRISDEMMKYYPRHNQSRIASSTVYIAQKKFDKSIETLSKAVQIEPANPIVLFNLAYVYNIIEDKANAKKYYELTIKYCDEEQGNLKEEAKKLLEALE